MITKTIFYFASLLGLGYLIVQGVESPGTLTVSWFNYYIEVNIMFAIVMVTVFIFMVQVMMHALTLLGVLPSVLRYKSENRKLKNGLDNLKSIALNLSLGNKNKAVKMAKKNQKIIPEYPVFDEMLNLKSKKDISNDIVDVRMAKEKVDEFLANYDSEKALKIVENILAEHPDSDWAKQKKYQILLNLAEFNAAFLLLNTLKKEKIISKEQYNMHAAFIKYELAQDAVEAVDALKLAEAGMKLQPNFIKLIEHCVIIFLEMKEPEKALKLLLSLAKNFNQGLATLDSFSAVTENLEVEEQIKWLNKYAKINSEWAGCIIAKAQANCLAEKTDEAIALLENTSESKETLEVLANLYKSTGDNVKSINALEKANLLKYIDPADLIPEYQAWQEHNLVVDENDDVQLAYQKQEGLMLDND